MSSVIVNKLSPNDPIPSWMQGIIGAVWMLYIIKAIEIEKQKKNGK